MLLEVVDFAFDGDFAQLACDPQRRSLRAVKLRLQPNTLLRRHIVQNLELNAFKVALEVLVDRLLLLLRPLDLTVNLCDPRLIPW